MKKLLTLILAAVLVIGVWLALTPWLAMQGIVDAAEAGDLEELDARIDFERLQSEANARISAEITEQTQDAGVLEQIGGMIAGEIAESAVNNALTPRGIANVVTMGSVALAFVPERFRGQELEWDVEREGPNSFRGVSTWEDGSAGPVMRFERDGIGWDLVGVDLAEF